MGAELRKPSFKSQARTSAVELHDDRRGTADKRLINLAAFVHNAKLLSAFD